jgi:hypothetical protein
VKLIDVFKARQEQLQLLFQNKKGRKPGNYVAKSFSHSKWGQD